MKVLLVNGSPHKNGCTHRALQEIQMQLKKEAIDSEIFWIGSTVQGCIGCCQCQESGTCVFDDILKIFLEKAKDTDGGPREGQSMEKLAKLRPCFVKGGTVTAANSSSLNDGAAAVVVMSKEKAEELGVTPKVKIEGYAIAGFDAELMGYSPKISSEKLADKLGLDLKSIDMFEINEAFASQAYAVSRDLGLDPEKVNIYGGGISIGHPIGATGAMLTVKVMYELMRTDKKDAMISMCIGGGQGISMYFTKCEA